jgi:aerobic carbon-monoxide dehydrogenase large subunit
MPEVAARAARSAAAIGNAVIDALWHLGVRDIALPIRPEPVWRALQSVRAKM